MRSCSFDSSRDPVLHDRCQMSCHLHVQKTVRNYGAIGAVCTLRRQANEFSGIKAVVGRFVRAVDQKRNFREGLTVGLRCTAGRVV